MKIILILYYEKRPKNKKSSEIGKALFSAAEKIDPSRGREKIMKAAQRYLRNRKG